MCAHCGESIVTIVTCPVCATDLSDLAYHSGPEFALECHVSNGKVYDDAHWALLETTPATD